MTYLLPPAETWEQWSSIFTNVALWKPVVSEICSREGIAYSCVRVGYPGTNAVFLLDRMCVIKIYNPFWKEFRVERELHVALGRDGAVPVPRIVSSGRFTDRIEWDYLITEFVEGEPVRELRDALSQEDLIDIAARLGEIVRALHNTDLAALENLTRNETGAQLATRRRVEVVKEIRAKGLLSDEVLDELGAFLQAAAKELGDHLAVLVHGDLTEDHLYVEEALLQKWPLFLKSEGCSKSRSPSDPSTVTHSRQHASKPLSQPFGALQ